jgi:hypothetical protein
VPDIVRVLDIVIAAAETVPVRVGEAEKTKLPAVPVSSVTERAKLAEDIELTKFLEASVATNLEAVNPEKLMVPEEVIPVSPEATPAAVTSQTLELIVTLSPLSPRVTTPLAVRVLERVRAAAEMVPVRVGEADITTLPVPVMALDTRFFEASVKTA